MPETAGTPGNPIPVSRGPLRPPLRSAATDPSKTNTARRTRAKHSGSVLAFSKALQRDIQDFAARLKSRYAVHMARDADARAFKKLCVRVLKQALPPGPGRPSEQSITLATKLRTQGVAWKEVYPRCIPNFGRLSPSERRQAETNLRSARRSRENARAKKQSRMAAGNMPEPEPSA
jgi:hypothetical protein